MMQIALGTTGWFFDFGKWFWGLVTGAISGGAGVLILTPALASIDTEHFTTNIFEPGPNTIKMMVYIFAYGAVKNMLTYMATNQIPSPFKDVHTIEAAPTKAGGVKLIETTYSEPVEKKEGN